MKLSDWLKQRKIRRYAFAETIGVSPSMVTEYCEQTTWPKKETVEAIVKATEGAVTANDLLSDEARKTIEAAQ